MAIGSLGLAVVAGALSTLSPCVLPLIPIVIGTAATEHRYGPLALAAGLALSFTAIGLFVATIGFSIGLDANVFRMVAALLLIGFGIVLLLPQLQEQFALAAGPVGSAIQNRFGQVRGAGVTGQFVVGLLLGAVWSPCAGPTLGAASVLASQSSDLTQVAATMGLFGIGAALPLLLIGTLSRERVVRLRGSLLSAGQNMKALLGALLLVTGSLVILGLDKSLETWLVTHSPEWLTQLTTSI